ncbi:hypothetical protein IAT38_005760 [Cryptococcus sp. DSM 104549]
MSQGTSPSAPIPSIISALEAHLLPTPSWPLLTSALSLFAHIQQFAAQLQSDAHRALGTQRERREEMGKLGVEEEVQIARGLLDERGERRVKAVSEREGEVMFKASLELRKHHVAAILTSGIQFSAQRTQQLIDAYFPDLSIDDETSWTSSPHRFIRCMSRAQAKELMKYRRTVMGWYDDAKQTAEDGQPPMRWKDLYHGRKDRGKAQLAQLIADIMREAREVWADAGDFRAIVLNDGSYDHEAWEREMELRRKGMVGVVRNEISLKDRRRTLGAPPRPKMDSPEPTSSTPASKPQPKRSRQSLPNLISPPRRSPAFTPRFMNRPQSALSVHGSPSTSSPLTAHTQTRPTSKAGPSPESAKKVSAPISPQKPASPVKPQPASQERKAPPAAAAPRPETNAGSSRPSLGSSTAAAGEVKKVQKRPRQSYTLAGPDSTAKKPKF